MCYITGYGDRRGNDKGIWKIDFQTGTATLWISLEGKANWVLEDGSRLWSCEERPEGCFLDAFDSKSGKQMASYKAPCFFSYGVRDHDHLLLASFSDGEDWIFDLCSERFTDSFRHERDGKSRGQSHFIAPCRKGKIAVENALYQLIFYEENGLKPETILEFDDIQPRLLSMSADQKYGYLNCEKSGELLTIDLEKRQLLNRQTIQPLLDGLPAMPSLQMERSWPFPREQKRPSTSLI